MSDLQLERSVLEAKERDELFAIALALGSQPVARTKKADLVVTDTPGHRRRGRYKTGSRKAAPASYATGGRHGGSAGRDRRRRATGAGQRQRP